MHAERATPLMSPREPGLPLRQRNLYVHTVSVNYKIIRNAYNSLCRCLSKDLLSFTAAPRSLRIPASWILSFKNFSPGLDSLDQFRAINNLIVPLVDLLEPLFREDLDPTNSLLPELRVLHYWECCKLKNCYFSVFNTWTRWFRLI